MFQLAEAGAGASTSGQLLSFVVPLIIMFAVFYFLLIRPQKKKQNTRNNMLNALQKGDKIVTIGGLHGTILEMTDDTVVIRVNDVTKLTFERSAISHQVKES
ncbi:preprotein translocase subunit YajC [Paenibacillus sp. D2_2]|uniref:preprotein translocase subunit YajC n=1 Tax=Paenibacillus sp. D2_2 TaxID=3073092 RepID=UPI0028151BD3|nr:preprotein translocase subunit YajC [Paenibacillus sp. D2_2]WMT40066.1 preprotein translocase subunit YajC [Paenibacillus sp. D2_2]